MEAHETPRRNRRGWKLTRREATNYRFGFLFRFDSDFFSVEWLSGIDPPRGGWIRSGAVAFYKNERPCGSISDRGVRFLSKEKRLGAPTPLVRPERQHMYGGDHQLSSDLDGPPNVEHGRIIAAHKKPRRRSAGLRLAGFRAGLLPAAGRERIGFRPRRS
jgi:hypothetical protein